MTFTIDPPFGRRAPRALVVDATLAISQVRIARKFVFRILAESVRGAAHRRHILEPAPGLVATAPAMTPEHGARRAGSSPENA
jgi:hypothetical protein